MAVQIIVESNSSKEEKYRLVIKQLQSLLEEESDIIANLANITSVIHYSFGFFWTGFYILKGQELVLGPFQGTVACTRIGYGKGVCGTCWQKNEAIVVPDVEQFEGHIACSSLSRSEIVVPVRNRKNEVVMVLDIDSTALNNFDKQDLSGLEQICTLVEQKHFWN